MLELDGGFMKKAFENAVKMISLYEEELNALNVFPVPDGDTGSNMLAALKEAYKRIEQLNSSADLSQVLNAVKDGTLMGARGNSGVILSQIFRGLAEGLERKKKAKIQDFSNALANAKKVAYSAVIKPVEGTMLTVIRKVAERAAEISKNSENYKSFFAELSKCALDTVNETPKLLPILREAGVVDAGAKGLYYIFEALRKTAAGEEIEYSIPIPEEGRKTPESAVAKVGEEIINYTYCTELICRLKDRAHDREIEHGVREYLEGIGDSIVLLVQNGLLKLHVHTDHPGDVIERVLKHGYLEQVKIDNMRQQHKHVAGLVEEDSETATTSKKEKKRYGIVAVAPSDAIARILSELGADRIVSGGQTMNPSLADLKDAVDELNAETIFVFPNNSNIILTAQKLKEFTGESKKIIVIPTKSIQECIGALTRFDESLEEEELFQEFEEGMNSVVSISVTYAVRDTKINGEKIYKGEYIALVGDRIVSHGDDREKITLEAIQSALLPEHEILTIIKGEGVSDEAANRLLKSLSERFPDLEVEILDGYQPHYFYLISLE